VIKQTRPTPANGHPSRAPDIAMILLNNSGMGGTERRFAQVYERLRRRGVSIALAVNESLLAGLTRTGALKPDGMPELVLKERIGWVASYAMGSAGGEEADADGRATPVRLKSALAFGLRKMDYLLACLSVGWWLLRRRPKLLHLVLGGAYVVLPLQLAGWAPPAVVSVVATGLREMVGSALGVRLYRQALRLARVVDALSEPIRDALVQEGVAPERIRVSAGSCVDTTRFHPASVKRPWVVFVGRLIPEKNPALFVGACALVHDRVPAARFFVLGGGPLRPDLVVLVQRHGLEGCTEVSWCDHVETVLGEALVFVSLQRTDNYPSQALLEAMACGAAVVATDVGVTWKLVDETVGLRVEAKPGSVADAVIRLLDNPAQATAMGQRGRERVMQHHSMDAYLDYLERVYKSAC